MIFTIIEISYVCAAYTFECYIVKRNQGCLFSYFHYVLRTVDNIQCIIYCLHTPKSQITTFPIVFSAIESVHHHQQPHIVAIPRTKLNASHEQVCYFTEF